MSLHFNEHRVRNLKAGITLAEYREAAEHHIQNSAFHGDLRLIALLTDTFEQGDATPIRIHELYLAATKGSAKSVNDKFAALNNALSALFVRADVAPESQRSATDYLRFVTGLRDKCESVRWVGAVTGGACGGLGVKLGAGLGATVAGILAALEVANRVTITVMGQRQHRECPLVDKDFVQPTTLKKLIQ